MTPSAFPHSAAIACSKHICLVGTLAVSMLCATNVKAMETRYVYDNSGTPLFELNFHDQGERYQDYEDATIPGYSTWQLSNEQKDAVVKGLTQWSDILGPGSHAQAPIRIYIGTYDEENADAGSSPNINDDPVVSLGVQQAIIDGTTPAEPGYIRIGRLDFGIPDHPSSNLSLDRIDLTAVLYHETAHTLGILSSAELDKQIDQITVWDTHLKDRNGNFFKPGMTVIAADLDADLSDFADNVFVVGEGIDSGVTFHGKHVTEVIGSDIGLTIEGTEYGFADLSHIELEHSLMSHQTYRNYAVFMEAELAALQDIGYTIDRRNFFGYSIYGDNLSLVNEHGYFARNENADDFLVGVANHASYGIGLHVYGKRNQITQAADLLAGGVAATGIRIDGSANSLTINQDVLIAADGAWGTGLLVSYGKDHRIISQGDIQALGTGGIAARFDFGHNLVGDDSEYRGSWIWTIGNENVTISEIDSFQKDPNGFELNLNGALVSSFDVAGKLEGTAAAIYISENAWVQNINILSGASVIGDIISDWNPENELIQYSGDDRLNTNLTFGGSSLSLISSGSLQDQPFEMTLNGAILGAGSIDMTLANGHLSVTKPVSVYSLTNLGHLTLLGSDAEGYSAQVTTHFSNASESTLETGFYADGRVDGIRTSSAKLDGRWLLRPLPDFYTSNTLITLNTPVTAETIDGWFKTIDIGQVHSPTLQFSQTAVSGSGTQITVTRNDNAYSRYAMTAYQASVGNSLDAIAQQAQNDMQNLFSVLDWSDENGTQIRGALSQLGSQAYDISAQAAIVQHSELNALIQHRLITQKDSRILLERKQNSQNSHTWQVWATPFGFKTKQNQFRQQASWESSDTGLLVGMDQQFYNGGFLGFHAALMTRQTAMDDTITADSDTVAGFIGLHSVWAPHEWNGIYLTAQGRIGLENTELSRRIAIGDYVRQTESSWNEWTGSISAGLGKDWQFSLNDVHYSLGPVGWVQYAFAHRPQVSEHNGQSANLTIDSHTYDALSLAAGAHVLMQTYRENGNKIDLDLLAAWHHDLLNSTFHSSASFQGYENAGFTSSTESSGRNALILQTSIRFAQSNGLHVQIEGGGEFFRKDAISANIGLHVGWLF